MANLYTKVKLYLEANSKTWEAENTNLELRNIEDGNGDYIHTWDVDGLNKPTDAEIASYETAGNTVEADIIAKENALPALKASAKAKLIAGESLTEDEANTIVL
tara:strand:- start:109 stop:420 length:312 start_codon:yes stop_codon:yes gene_type:complete